MSSPRLDIGVGPVPDAPYERGKCGYRLLQFGAAGVPFVASPVGVNRDDPAGVRHAGGRGRRRLGGRVRELLEVPSPSAPRWAWARARRRGATTPSTHGCRAGGPPSESTHERLDPYRHRQLEHGPLPPRVPGLDRESQLDGVELTRVTVVDNASSDGSADALEAIDLPLDVLRNRHNVGFGAACNQGAAAQPGRSSPLPQPGHAPAPGHPRRRGPVHVRSRRGRRGDLRRASRRREPARRASRAPASRRCGSSTGKLTGLDRIAPRVFPSHHVSLGRADRQPGRWTRSSARSSSSGGNCSSASAASTPATSSTSRRSTSRCARGVSAPARTSCTRPR